MLTMDRVVDSMQSCYEQLLQSSSDGAAKDQAGAIFTRLIESRQSIEYIEINNITEIELPGFLSVSNDHPPTSKCFSVRVNLCGPSWTRIHMPSTLQICYVKPGDKIQRTAALVRKPMKIPLVPEGIESALVLYTDSFDPNVPDGDTIPEKFQVIKGENILRGVKFDHIDFLTMKMIAFAVCGFLKYDLVELLVTLRICCGRQPTKGCDYVDFKFFNVCISDIDAEKRECVWRIIYEKNFI